tara:strand:+ start:990 stop:2177 length:1188 start_codon:yes stop_codon:yes gene_type:complete
MVAENEKFLKKILDLYGEDATYFQKHGTDIAITITVISGFVIATATVNVLSRLKFLRKDFHKMRCDPTMTPFAGIIAAPEGTSKMQFASKNFEQCTRNVLKDVAAEAFNPVDAVMSMFTDTFSAMISGVKSLMQFFDGLRDSVAKIPTMLYSILFNVLVPLKRVMRSIEDIFGRMNGVMANVLRIGIGTQLLVQSVLMFIINFVLGLLETMGIVIAVLIASFFLAPLGWLGVLALVVLVIITLPVILLLKQVFRAYTGGMKVPKIPTCFHPDSEVVLTNGTSTKISEVKLGDVLDGDSEVQVKMRLENKENLFEFLDTDTTVSGSHLIFDRDLGQFIPVAEAYQRAWPNLRKSRAKTKELICLITSNHIIKIGPHIFHDWEDNNGSACKTLHKPS